jgi:hypothetical protein
MIFMQQMLAKGRFRDGELGHDGIASRATTAVDHNVTEVA